jgi:hypothetical protein
VLVSASGDWGQIEPGVRDSKMNRILQAFEDAVNPVTEGQKRLNSSRRK